MNLVKNLVYLNKLILSYLVFLYIYTVMYESTILNEVSSDVADVDDAVPWAITVLAWEPVILILDWALFWPDIQPLVPVQTSRSWHCWTCSISTKNNWFTTWGKCSSRIWATGICSNTRIYKWGINTSYWSTNEYVMEYWK